MVPQPPPCGGLGQFFPDRAVEALDYIANNNKLEKGLRCYARRATKEVWEGLRLDAEAPSGGLFIRDEQCTLPLSPLYVLIRQPYSTGT